MRTRAILSWPKCTVFSAEWDVCDKIHEINRVLAATNCRLLHRKACIDHSFEYTFAP